jgi:hypothetical protein
MLKALQGRCGLFCGHCEIYIAYSTNNLTAQKRIARAYSETKGKTIQPVQVKCLGCKGTSSSLWRSSCQVRLCAEEKGLEFCYQCREFPCDTLQSLFEVNPQARENLRTISKIGPDAWLSQQLSANHDT